MLEGPTGSTIPIQIQCLQSMAVAELSCIFYQKHKNPLNTQEFPTTFKVYPEPHRCMYKDMHV